MSQHTTGPCAHSSVSDPGQVTAAAQKDQRSTREHTGLAREKAVNDSDGRTTPMGITGGESGQQSCLRREKGGMQGKRD